ncbi:MAG: hypothetical protein FWC39_02865 [Bacteroidetes bacterium]|nr:hypothetical protein [Bacteroidota bacterium]
MNRSTKYELSGAKKLANCLLSLLFIFSIYSCNNEEEKVQEEVQEETIIKYGIQVNDFEVIESTFPKNKNLTEVFLEAGLSKATVYYITQNCDSVLNLRKIKAGNPVTKMICKMDSRFGGGCTAVVLFYRLYLLICPNNKT